jgi:superfamily I DNA and/or RNA helicase
LAGDHFQLGPIYGFGLSGEIDNDGLFDCIFTFLQKKNKLVPTALNENYRNNSEIAEWSKNRFYKEGFIARNPERRLQISIPVDIGEPQNWTEKLFWSEDYKKILDPASPVAVVKYESNSYTVSNPFEADSVVALAWLYKQLLLNADENFNEEDFWKQKIGIITPHRAQMALIRNKLLEIGFTGVPRLWIRLTAFKA